MEYPMFLIKTYRFSHTEQKNRVYFWQTPWVEECRPYLTTNRYDEPVTLTSREIGGWVTSSRYATVYPDAEEAGEVNAGRGLFGDVVPAAKYLQP